MEFLNQFSRQSYLLDNLVFYLSLNYFLKTIPWMIAIWWLWFSPKNVEDQLLRRAKLLTCLLGTVLAIALNFFLTYVLPFRSRPMHEPSLSFVAPFGVDVNDLTEWSSFPSDHAAMIFALVLGIWMISSRLGIIGLAHALIIFLFPRIYLGFHYPTDVLAGILIAAPMVWVANLKISQRFLIQPFFKWHAKHPASFYSGLFLLTSQMAILFEPLRRFAKSSIALLKIIIS
jgi:undecaprenyl-diphosphatase